LQTVGKPDLVTETTSTDWTFISLAAKTSYTVKVEAYIESWDGTKTATTTGITSSVITPEDANLVAVSSPTALTATPQATQATLNWVAPQNVVGKINNYTVTVKQVGKADRVLTTVNATPSYVVTGLTENTSYTFEVKANAASANGFVLATSTPVSVTKSTPYASNTVIVNAPQNLTVTAPSSGQVNVSWAAPVGLVGTLTGYKVTVKEGATLIETKAVTSLATSFTALKENTAYTVEVAAVASSPDNTKTVTSPVISAGVTTPYSPSTVKVSAPTGLKVSAATHDTLTATWIAPTGSVGKITDYTVILKQGATVKGTYTTAVPSYNFVGLDANTTYTVEVRANAVAADGITEASSVAAVTSGLTAKSPIVKVAAPVVTVSGVGADRMTVSWTKPLVTGTITGYRVTVKQGTVVKQMHNLTAVTTTKQLLLLAENTTYTVTVDVFAVAPNGINKATTSTVKTVKTGFTAASTVKVAAPAALATTVSRTAVTATWRQPAVTGRVVNYTVTLKEGTRVVKTAVTTAGKYSFTALKANTAYTITVTANAVSANGKYKATASVSKLVRTLR
jgi:hypothetical protein